jgi:carbon storage regulator
MLVLTRKLDECIVINGDILVTVLAIEGEKVKIGIQAPREVSIYRKELWEAINEQAKIAELLNNGPEPESFKELREFLGEQGVLEEPAEPDHKK